MKVRDSIHTLENEIQQSARVISELDVKSKDISSIINVIRGIAEQANLLALNAATAVAAVDHSEKSLDAINQTIQKIADMNNEIASASVTEF